MVKLTKSVSLTKPRPKINYRKAIKPTISYIKSK